MFSVVWRKVCTCVQEVVGRGVVDANKVAVGGHSYGAFMAANLLAADTEGLFACGIAQSGAYNRTLTPFGFQSEQRTLWEAPETYHAMSPFLQVRCFLIMNFMSAHFAHLLH